MAIFYCNICNSRANCGTLSASSLIEAKENSQPNDDLLNFCLWKSEIIEAEMVMYSEP